MPTGQKFALINRRSLLTMEDMRDRVLSYLMASHKESTRARWDVDGSFNVATTGTATPGVDDSMSFSAETLTDGLGNVITLGSASTELDLLFENLPGITYYFAASWASIASDIRINPRNGLPEWVSEMDTLGLAGAPDNVIDNGNGTLTFWLDSLFGESSTHAGEQVSVWLRTPQSELVEVSQERLTVVWNGAHNAITTAGNLGQTSVDTDPSLYVVLKHGALYRRTAFPAGTGFVTLGTVVGNGGSASPMNTTTQRILSTVNAASNTSLTPYGWIGSTNMQAAMQEIVDDLAEADTATSGATRIGIRPADFTPTTGTDMTAAGGGIGTSAAGQPFEVAGSRRVMTALREIDVALRKRRAYTRIYAPAVGPTHADDVAGTFDTTGGRHLIRYATGTTVEQSMLLGTATTGGDTEGEAVPASIADRAKATIRYTGSPVLTGRFRDINFEPRNTGATRVIDFNGTLLDRCVLSANAMRLITSSENELFVLQNSYVGASPNAPTYVPKNACLNFESSVPGTYLFENNVFQGNANASATSIVGVTGSFAAASADKVRVITFRGCTFIQGHVAQRLINLPTSNVKYVFEKCVFVGLKNSTAAALISATRVDITFRDCYIYAPGVAALDIISSQTVIDGLYIVSGDGASAGSVTTPNECVDITADQTGLHVSTNVRNLVIYSQIGGGRPTNASANFLVSIQGTWDGAAGGKTVNVDGLTIAQFGEAPNAGGLLRITDGVSAKNVDVMTELPQSTTPAGTKAIVEFVTAGANIQNRPVADNLQINVPLGLSAAMTGTAYYALLLCAGVFTNVAIHGTDSLPANPLTGVVGFQSNTTVKGLRTRGSFGQRSLKGLVHVMGGGCTLVDFLPPDNATTAAQSPSVTGGTLITAEGPDFQLLDSNFAYDCDGGSQPAIRLDAARWTVGGLKLRHDTVGTQGFALIDVTANGDDGVMYGSVINWRSTTAAINAMNLAGDNCVISGNRWIKTAAGGTGVEVADTGVGNQVDINMSGMPTLTTSNLSNISAATFNSASFVRVGNQVFVTAKFTATRSVTGAKSFRFTLPVARGVTGNFTTADEAPGSASVSSTNAEGLGVISVASVSGGQTVQVNWTDTGTSGAVVVGVSFSYKI